MKRDTRFCDGVNRRHFLRCGSAGVFGAGWTLPQLLQSDASATETSQNKRSLIIVFLRGGLSTIDTFDMKPDAPKEYRSPHKPIRTSNPDIEITEHFPRLARHMDKLAVIAPALRAVAVVSIREGYLEAADAVDQVAVDQVAGFMEEYGQQLIVVP